VSFVLSCLLGYAIGSIPTAFLLVRWKTSADIRSAGSGNVGALNSFQVTRSKLVGFLVLLADLLKGVMAVLVTRMVIEEEFMCQGAAGVAAVIGHNFPVWLGWKGGRGLATAAGVMLVLGWWFVGAWGLLWAMGFALTRNVNMGNAIASALLMVASIAFPEAVGERLFTVDVLGGEVQTFALTLFTVILAKHVEPVREYLHEKRESAVRH
jgi:glycerol-3-phosphate acyltransferase PlsY